MENSIDSVGDIIARLEVQKTELLGLMEKIHQVDNKNHDDPENKFVSQEVPKMQLMERYRSQLIQVEAELKVLKNLPE